MPEEIISLAIETIKMGKQAIVFAPTRSSAEKTAEEISKLTALMEIELENGVLKAASSPTRQCRRLSHCVRKGIAFHHAGLLAKQRDLIEDNFKSGKIKIICCTPTLSAGLSMPAYRVLISSLKRFSGSWGMDWIPVLEYLQMAGRAGRPEYEKEGQSIVIAKSEKEKGEIYERYVCGEPEEIYSKLAAEPILRTHLLSLISSGIISDHKTMLDFFSETFWAKQFKDMDKLKEILERMLIFLEEVELINISGNRSNKSQQNSREKEKIKTNQKKISYTEFFKAATSWSSEENVLENVLDNVNKSKNKELVDEKKYENGDKKIDEDKSQATTLGKRVAELYLDPYTARHILDCLKTISESKNNDRNNDSDNDKNNDKNNENYRVEIKSNKSGEIKSNKFLEIKINPFSYLQMVSHTLELRPLLRVKARDGEKIQEEMLKRIDYLIEEEPSQFDSDEYGEFMNSIKTALFFEEWIDEKDEDFLLETFDITPGEIRVKLETADWLLYATEELAKLQGQRDVVSEVARLRFRLQEGVREELLALLKLRGIGRVRGRRLFKAGIKDLGDIKKIDLTSLSQILGKALAEDVKKQVGEEVVEVSAGKRTGQLSIDKF
ncbi:hypothetical protein HYU21_00660 [Candidatus Woesearchaeota archaeon]|nr:hypothetical protein [Candidatus Woesearchaeota archaeon]